MGLRVVALALGLTGLLIGLACRTEESSVAEGGGYPCTASCAEAIQRGGEPCVFDQPGRDAYKAFFGCVGMYCANACADAGPAPLDKSCTECTQDKCPSALTTCLEK